MGKTTLTWEYDGLVGDGFKIYRADSPMDPENLPLPLATVGIGVREYVDETVIDDATYYYRIGSYIGGTERISEEIEHIAENAGDLHWDQVVSLLHFDGDLTDETGHTWQIEGTGLSLQSDNTKFGSGAIRNTNKLSSMNGNPLSGLAANEPFTLELWFCLESPGAVDVLMSQSGNGGNSDQFFFIAPPNYATSPPNPHNYYVLGYFRGGNATVAPQQVMYGSTEVVANTWYHAAYVYDGTFSRLFLNGVLESEVQGKGWTVTAYPFRIAGSLVPNYSQYRVGFGGSIDEVRITKGVARYTGNFTPPAEPFPSFGLPPAPDPYWSDVAALLHFDGDLHDETGRVWTGSGAFSYVGGKFRTGFKSSGGHVSTPTSPNLDLSTGDFTIECFMNLTGTSGLRALLSSGVQSWATGNTYILVDGSNRLEIGSFADGLIWLSSATLPSSGTFHFCLERLAGELRLFVDGVLVDSELSGAAINLSTNGTRIGVNTNNLNRFSGVIDELRITKGVARYAGNFTSPAAPFANFGN